MDNGIEEISKKVFKYCLKGDLRLIIQILRPYTFRQRTAIVNYPHSIETFNVKENVKSETTCLLVACLKNRHEIVKYLVGECGASLEQLACSRDLEDWDCLTFFINKSKRHNDVLTPNFNYTASVLWHACRSSDFKIIKYLIQRHADVNNSRETILNSTPLMVACCKSRLEEVEFLLKDAKADINQQDINGETCLFYAIRCNTNCVSILEKLLKYGADVNLRNKAGKTVLELAADLELTSVIEFLIGKQAQTYSHKNDLSILTKSAVNGYISMYSLLFESANINVDEKINSLEIVGVTSAYGSVRSDKLSSFSNIPYSVMYWECSIDLREANPSQVKPKKIRSIDGFLKEFNTYQDLQKISENIIEFKMQSLWIIDRMLYEYPNTQDYLTLVDFNFYDFFEMNSRRLTHSNDALTRSAQRQNYINNFSRLSKLWLFGLSIQIEYLEALHSSTLRNIIGLICYIKIVQESNTFKSRGSDEINQVLGETLIKLYKIVIFEMISAGLMTTSNDLNFNDLLQHRLKGEQKLVKNSKTIESSNIEIMLRIAIYLVRLIANLEQDSILTYNHMVKLKYLINAVVSKKLNIGLGNSTIFGLLVKNDLLKRLTIDSEFDFYDYVTTSAIRLSLECGLDPNQNASNRCPKKTSLNSAVFSKDIGNKKQADEIILLLVKYGAHLDYSTENGQTIIDKYNNKYMVSFSRLINPIKHTTLQCLAAKAINNHKIHYKNVLSKHLSEFVSRH